MTDLDDPLVDLATAIADLLGHLGFAFVEDPQVDALAEVLRDFFDREGIPVDERRVADYYRSLNRQHLL